MADYTKLTPNEISGLLARYGIDHYESCSVMPGGQANSSFKITTDKDQFILSVCDEKSFAEIDGLCRVLEHLASNRFPTSRLVRTVKAEPFIRLSDKPVYLKRYMEGDVIADLTPEMLAQVGRTMADLHAIAPLENMPDRLPFGFEAFDQLFAMNLQHPYVDWLNIQKTYLADAIDRNMPKGFIHGDIFWDNLLFSDRNLVAVLDFEEACFYYKLYDIGMCMIGCCLDNHVFNISKAAHLLHGYQQKCELSEKEKNQLKPFVVYAAATSSFWRFRQYNIYYPGTGKAESYKELSGVADAIQTIPTSAFFKTPW